MTSSIDSKKNVSISDQEHVWTRLSTYLGGDALLEREMLIYQKKKIVKEIVKYSQQSQKMFEEIIQNSIDNYVKHGYPSNYYIRVKMNSREFSV